VIQVLPGHGWLDVVGVILIFGCSIGGFFAGLAVSISRVDGDADGIPERWPG
jgi:hypothetical protein